MLVLYVFVCVCVFACLRVRGLLFSSIPSLASKKKKRWRSLPQGSEENFAIPADATFYGHFAQALDSSLDSVHLPELTHFTFRHNTVLSEAFVRVCGKLLQRTPSLERLDFSGSLLVPGLGDHSWKVR